MIKNKKQYNPEMHTAEHILNQTMVRMFGCERSFNNHIERKKSKCDYHFDRNLTEEEIAEINNQVNKIISENHTVKEEIMDYAKAIDKYKLKKFNQNPPPTIRIIHVGNYDSCPCSGEHVKKTSEIGIFRITTTSFDEGVLRIRFKLKRPE